MLNAWYLAAAVWLAAALVAILPWGQEEVGRGDVVLAGSGVLLAVVCFVQAWRTSPRGDE